MDLGVITETEKIEESKERRRPNARGKHIEVCKSSSVPSAEDSESEAYTLMQHSETLTKLV